MNRDHWIDRTLVECQGKEKLTPQRAREIAGRMRQRNKASRVSAYRCASCNCWHVGSRPAMLPKANRRGETS